MANLRMILLKHRFYEEEEEQKDREGYLEALFRELCFCCWINLLLYWFQLYS
jgi:hypothetical protein